MKIFFLIVPSFPTKFPRRFGKLYSFFSNDIKRLFLFLIMNFSLLSSCAKNGKLYSWRLYGNEGNL